MVSLFFVLLTLQFDFVKIGQITLRSYGISEEKG